MSIFCVQTTNMFNESFPRSRENLHFFNFFLGNNFSKAPKPIIALIPKQDNCPGNFTFIT